MPEPLLRKTSVVHFQTFHCASEFLWCAAKASRWCHYSNEVLYQFSTITLPLEHLKKSWERLYMGGGEGWRESGSVWNVHSASHIAHCRKKITEWNPHPSIALFNDRRRTNTTKLRRVIWKGLLSEVYVFNSHRALYIYIIHLDNFQSHQDLHIAFFSNALQQR